MADGSGQVPRLEFSKQVIDAAVKDARLLAMQIEFAAGDTCGASRSEGPREAPSLAPLSREEVQALVLQAKDLGAVRIVILAAGSTEPSEILEMIRAIASPGLEVELRTDGSMLTADCARQLFERRVRVVLEMGSLDQETQDRLTGRKGIFMSVPQAFEKLRAAGYPSSDAFLAVSATICEKNLDGIVPFWRWLRARSVVPQFRAARPRAEGSSGQLVDPLRLEQLYGELAAIDQEEYGQVWRPQPPLVGGSCMGEKFSCLVTSQGDVMPSTDLRIRVGNIREQSLADIIKDSEVLEDLRDHTLTIKGPCAFCEKAASCWGCRASAFDLTGDYLASDPLCWKNVKRQDAIARLPVAVDAFIPQQLPMRVVDKLLKIGERSGELSVTITEEMPFVESGAIDEVVYLEMIAQAIAALQGFKVLGSRRSSPEEGYLVGARKIEILGRACVGEPLNIRVRKEARFGNFGIVIGTVSRAGTLLARGEIKIWRNAASSGCPETRQQRAH